MADVAVIYLRVSTPKQEQDGYGLDYQERQCRAYCALKGYSVLDVCKDAYTGMAGDDERSGFDQALRLIGPSGATVLVMFDNSRFTREGIAADGYYRTLVQRAGGRMECLNEGDLERGEYGDLIRAINAMGAKKEWDKTRERTMLGMKERIADGKYRGHAFPKYGYVVVDGVHQIDPETAPVMRRIFEDVAAGKNCYQIAAELTAEGVPPPTMIHATRGRYKSPRPPSTAWRGEVVAALTRDTRYYGDLQVNREHKFKTRVKQPNGEMKTVAKTVRADESEIVHQSCPALVSRELWDAVQAIRGQNKERSPRNNHYPDETLLRGIAYCGYCQHKLTASRRSDANKDGVRVWRYRCSGAVHGRCPDGWGLMVSAKALDQEIWDGYILPLLRSPAAIQEAIARRSEDHDGQERRLAERRASLETNIQKNEQAQTALLLQMETVTTPEAIATLAARLDIIAPTIRELREQLAALSEQQTDAAKQSAAWDIVTAKIERYRHDVDTLSHEEKQTLLFALGVRVYCFKQSDRAAYEHFHTSNLRALELEFEDEPEHAARRPLYRVMFYTEEMAKAAGVPTDTAYSRAANATLAGVIDQLTSGCRVDNMRFPILTWEEVAACLPVA